MKTLTLFIYAILTFSWLYILIFSYKELIKNKYSSKSLFSLLFIILIIDALRTLIESTYFGTRLASQYGVLPKELFTILSNPLYLFIPKLINAIAALTIIILIFKKWYPEKLKEEDRLKQKYLQEKKDKEELAKLNKELDKLVEEKTKELELLNKNLEKRVKEEVRKNKIQEQKLFSQSKMATMGEMIKNIAHQWRQPLNTITTVASGTSYKQEFGILEQKELRENLQHIVTTTNHMSQTINDFQNFFKPNKLIEEFSNKVLIENSLKILEPMLKSSNIHLSYEIKEILNIKQSQNELLQVLINIMNNSKDAYKDKKYEKHIKITSYKEENSCVISILDNAGGIENNILKKVFEPYFTTKEKDNGTGLGLYMSKEIIEKHMNGQIKIHVKDVEYNHTINKGTEFILIIPNN